MKGFVLLVEDNVQIMNGNVRMLKRQGYETAAALTLTEARASVEKRMPDVIVLDIMLPDGSGLDFMRELRRTSDVPILLLTGLTTPADIIRGLNDGGDDYLAKPYDFGVLLARIEALLRRAAQAGKLTNMLMLGNLTLDIISGAAFIDGAPVLLSRIEFSLLLLFARNEGKTIDAEYIYETVWKQPMIGDKRTLQKRVSDLRVKLADGKCGYTINSIYGKGYCFEKYNPSEC